MSLISCYIDGFGKLNNMEVQFEDGINTFVQDNGWGKSTLAAFIRVMLYGFDGETKRNDIENERKRYRPWAGAFPGLHSCSYTLAVAAGASPGLHSFHC